MVDLSVKSEPVNSVQSQVRHVVIYHANCSDGFCSAYLLWKYFMGETAHMYTDTVYIPMHYNTPLPDNLTKRDIVYLVDFSYKRDVMIELADRVHYVWVLDHHKTAKEELASLKLTDEDNVSVFFDMERCGARLVHDFIAQMKLNHLEQLASSMVLPQVFKAPKLVDYIEDRDLWKFKLPYSKEINAYIRAMEFNFEIWKAVETNLETVFEVCAGKGAIVLQFQQQQVNKAADVAANMVFPFGPDAGDGGTPVKIVNCTTNHSEVGDELCTRHDIPFAVTWFQRKDGMFQYSLRSRSGFDVSEVAKRFGGGGHPAASGFESELLLPGV